MAQPLMGFSYQRRDALFRDIVHSLEEMPVDLREVFVLSHYEHLAVDDIARRMSLAPRELDDLLERANEIFFRNLHDCGRA